jgi:methylthioribose-1-phosphate isomerase
MEEFSPIRWRNGALELLDQTRLPAEETWLRCELLADVEGAIRRLSVRGAPAIGVAAGYGLVTGLLEGVDFDDIVARLAATRPTAVNLRWALDLGTAEYQRARSAGERPVDRLLAWASRLQADDIAANRALGGHGAALVAHGDRILTHCNTGALATAGYGTALGVIRAAHEAGKVGHVWVDETRPLLQGARLTAWECQKLGVSYQVVTDSMVGALMARGLVDRVFLGADRIAANGDAANKIGTYTVAVVAARHGVPFYVAAPVSTIDPKTPTGREIPIEERDSREVTAFGGREIAPAGARALNFAFDVTPAELISGIVTERGVLAPPFDRSIGALFETD